MIYVVKPPTRSIRTTIVLPASKSISNRVLIIRALSGQDITIHNLADCDDTVVMQESLAKLPFIVDVGAAGTSMRFLTAFLACQEGQRHVITGTERMKQRPIHVLVDALRKLGADIEYLEEIGYPPLRIRGKKLVAPRTVSMDGSVSSQYISAMLLIAPMLEGGLRLRLEGEIASKPYINMTLALMNTFGASAHWCENAPVLEVEPIPYDYKNKEFTVEPDWSAAAFWMEILALRGAGKHDRILFPGLSRESMQGDVRANHPFRELGVIIGGGIHPLGAAFDPRPHDCMAIDFTEIPDLAQALVVSSCLLDQPFIYSGLESLHIKETDRIEALKTELAKLGYVLRGGGEEDNGVLIWQRGSCPKVKKPVIQTYKDHRMAMAFAPVCIKTKEIRIANPEVVTKSYPRFWDDLRSAGFSIKEVKE